MSPTASVLVVEDENIVALDIQAQLSSLGYRVAGAAATGEDAIVKVAESRPDLVLMDIQLRGALDGIAAAQQIRSRFSIPVIYLTAFSDDETIGRARTTEPFGYLLKPFDQRELQVVIEMALYRHKIERALVESERRLDAILRSIEDAVIATDGQGRVTFMNAAAEALLSCRSSTAVGSPVEGVVRVSKGVQRGEPDWLTDFRGRRLPVEQTATPIQSGDGPVGVVIAIRDVSERQRAVAEHNRFVQEQAARTAIEHAHGQVQFLAQASEVLTASLDLPTTLNAVANVVVPFLADWCVIHLVEEGKPRAVAAKHAGGREALVFEVERRFPLDPDLPTGYPNVIRTCRPEIIAEITDEILERAASSAEHLRILRDLDLRSTICTPLTVRGQTIGTVTLVNGKSRKPFTTEDLTLAGELTRRCASAIDNARLYQEAQEAIRVRDDFLSIASHELRTPLSALQLKLGGAVRLFEKSGANPEDAVARVRGAAEQADRLATLTDELLDASRIRAGKMSLELQEVDLGRLAKDVVARMKEQADSQGCTVSVQAGSVTGRWDPSRIEQVLTNLLSNALKYGNGAPVDVAISGDSKFATIVVRDRGIGVDPDTAQRIFGRFERAVSPRNYGGLGLGLYITHEIVTAHGGEITVTSAPGQGSTFTVKLPLATSNAVAG